MSTHAALCETCRAPATLNCSGCLSVSYCNKKHQKADWLKHRSKCRAYEIRSTPEFGRHIVASRDLREDDIIVSEAPFVIGPRNFLPAICCVTCCRQLVNPLATAACPRCKWPVCSVDCSGLNSNSSAHWVECPLLKTIARTMLALPYHVVLPLRCLLLQTQNPDRWTWIEEKAAYAEAGKEDTENDSLVSTIEALLTPLSISAPHLLVDSTRATIRRLLNVLDVYAVDGSTHDFVDIGGLYSVAGHLRQSCSANTSVFFGGAPDETAANCGAKMKTGQITVKAARDIRKGEILTRNSGHTFYCTIARLGEQKLFKNLRCFCVRCKDPHENGSDFGTLRCIQCSGWIVPMNTEKIELSAWKCESCKRIMSAKESVSLLGSLSLEMKVVIADSFEDIHIPKLEAFLSRLQLHLHTNHQLCFAIKCVLLKTYGRDGGVSMLGINDLERKAALGRNVVDLMKKLGPPHFAQEVIFKADCYLELVRAEAEILKRKFTTGVWNSERVVKAATECKASFRRILRFVAVSPSESLESQHQKIVTQVGSEKFSLLRWMKKNGLAVLDD